MIWWRKSRSPPWLLWRYQDLCCSCSLRGHESFLVETASDFLFLGCYTTYCFFHGVRIFGKCKDEGFIKILGEHVYMFFFFYYFKGKEKKGTRTNNRKSTENFSCLAFKKCLNLTNKEAGFSFLLLFFSHGNLVT